MDGSVATVVLLIFVFSIINGVTGNKSKKDYAEPPVPIEQKYDTSRTFSSVEIMPPSSDFTSGYSEDLTSKIKRFILSYAKKVDEWEAQSITDSIVKHSKSYDVNPKLVCGLIARESRFNRFAISSSGAQGLGQLLPSTASGLNVSDPFDIDQNVMGTTRYVKSLLDRFSGINKVPFALAGYLEGPNIVKRNNGFKAPSKQYIEDILKITNKI